MLPCPKVGGARQSHVLVTAVPRDASIGWLLASSTQEDHLNRVSSRETKWPQLSPCTNSWDLLWYLRPRGRSAVCFAGRGGLSERVTHERSHEGLFQKGLHHFWICTIPLCTDTHLPPEVPVGLFRKLAGARALSKLRISRPCCHCP